MSKVHPFPAILLIACASLASADAEPEAEVRLPYHEFKTLLEQSRQAKTPAPAKPSPEPRLLSSHLSFAIENGQPVMTGHFRVVSFSDDIRNTPLASGDITIDDVEPKDALIVPDQGTMSLVSLKPGLQNLQLRFIPRLQPDCTIELPPCPSAVLEIGKLPEEHAVVLIQDDHETPLTANQRIALPVSGGALTLKLLNRQETKEALRPPEPSAWSWQHQAIVEPIDGELQYLLLTHATGQGGSGVDALLDLPQDARQIDVAGEDLISHRLIRNGNRQLQLALQWKTRGILDRQIVVRYHMPLRPLDPEWTLQTPGDEQTRTRFILPESPRLAYNAEGLSIRSTPEGLPGVLISALEGRNCRFLESSRECKLHVSRIPVAATAEGIIHKATWSAQLEKDGAMMLSGLMTVGHRSPLDLELTAPAPLKLLTCEINGQATQPTDLGDGRIMIHLPQHEDQSTITCSFTGRQDPLHPVEGTLGLTLPRTPLFIQTLNWVLQLPENYQAETHGNLNRDNKPASSPSTILLTKNFSRNEEARIQLFYQRTDNRR